MMQIIRNRRGSALFVTIFIIAVISGLLTVFSMRAIDHVRNLKHSEMTIRLHADLDNAVEAAMDALPGTGLPNVPKAEEGEPGLRAIAWNAALTSETGAALLDWRNDGRDNNANGEIDERAEAGFVTLYAAAAAQGNARCAEIILRHNDNGGHDVVVWSEWNPSAREGE